MNRAYGSSKGIAAGMLGLGLSVILLQAGCEALRGARPHALDDGTYKVACRKSLADCLGSVDAVCPDGYTVVRGEETWERLGSPPVVTEIFSAEAVVRCQTKKTVFGGGSPEPTATVPAPPARATSAKPSPPASCFPGVSQACVGSAGCAGGQICAADGHAFGPCDCGGRDAGASDAADSSAELSPRTR